MAERVATGEVHIGIDNEATAGLRKIEAEFDRTMAAIDRQEATVRIEADTKDLDKEIALTKAKLQELEDAHTDLVGAQKGASTKRINALKKELEAQQKVLASEKERLEWARRSNKQSALTTQRLAAEEKAYASRAKVVAKADSDHARALQNEQRLMDRNESMRVRERTDQERRGAAMAREIENVGKLDREYMGLQERLEKFEQIRRKARGDERETIKIDVEAGNVAVRMQEIRAEVWTLAHRDPISIPVKPELGRTWGTAVRAEFVRASGSLLGAAIGVGQRIGRSLGSAISTGSRDTLNRGFSGNLLALERTAKSLGTRIGGAMVSGVSRVGHALEGLSEATIRLGPFTTSIRGAILGLSLLGPVLIDLVGAAGALVGSLGAATLGLGALAAGAAAGAIPAFLGMGLVIKKVVTEFKNVQTAQKAYDDALRKGNTDLAKTKLEELRATMGNVSKETAKQVGSWHTLQDAWNKATEPARASVFTTIGEGIKTATQLMPMFATNTNQAMKVASDGVNKWLEGLRSAEGKAALDEMMDNFTESLGPALGGMGSLIAYIGRVGQIASRFLPDMARDFREWADGVNSVSTSDLEGKVNRVVESAKNLGRFFMSAGRLIKAFFSQGVDAGDGLIDTMTKAMDTWREGFETPEGKDNLANFFQESSDGALSLWHALSPIVSSFVKWASEMAPLARAFFSFSSAIGDVVNALLDVTALRGPITALITTLGALWTLGKIKTATTAIRGFIAAVFGMAAAEETLAAAEAEQAVAGEAAAVANAEVAASAGGAGAAGALGGLAGALSGASGKLAMFASRMGVAAAVAYGGYEAFKAGIPVGHDLADSMTTQVKALDDIDEKLKTNMGTLRSWAEGSDTAREKVDELFGPAASEAISTTSKALARYGKGVKDATTKMIAMGKMDKAVQVRAFVTFHGTEKLAQVSRQAEQLGGSKQVVNILANADNAKQAVNQIQNLLDKLKQQHAQNHLSIDMDNSKVVSAFKEVDSAAAKTEKDHHVPVDSPDAPRVMGDLSDIAGIRYNPKHVVVNYSDGGTKSYLDSIKTAQDAIDRVINIVTHYSSTGSPPHNANASGRTPGRRETSLVGEGGNMQGAKEHIVNTKTGTVTTVDGPTLMMLAPSDAVVPTEPRFRDRGRTILGEVAKDLGLSRFAVGKKPGHGGHGHGPQTHPNPNTPSGFLGLGSFGDDSSFEPGHFVDSEAEFKPSHGKNKILKSETKWAGYIDYLHDQQDNWSREVSIRESQVKEPENTIVRDPAHDYNYTDPLTGEVTQIEAYKANTDDIKPYKEQLAAVLAAMAVLLDIIRELVRAIPMALKANKQEAAYRAHLDGPENEHGSYARHIKHLQNRKFGHGKKQQAAKQRNDAHIQELQQKKSENASSLSALRDDQGTLNDSMVDAGFSFREAQIAKQETYTMWANADPEALTEAQEATTEQIPKPGSGGSGGGGGGTEGGISYGAQASLADTEKANILKEFGSNFIPNAGGTGGAAGAFAAAASGMGATVAPLAGTSPSGISPSGTLDTRAASGAVASSAAAGGAVAAGGGGFIGGGAAAPPGAGGDTVQNVTVNNTFATVPPDPHTWARGVEFEIGSVV